MSAGYADSKRVSGLLAALVISADNRIWNGYWWVHRKGT